MEYAFSTTLISKELFILFYKNSERLEWESGFVLAVCSYFPVKMINLEWFLMIFFVSKNWKKPQNCPE